MKRRLRPRQKQIIKTLPDKYIDNKKEIQNFLLDLTNDSIDFQKITNFLDNLKLNENQEELISFMYLLSRISKNHFKKTTWLEIIKHIILYYEITIKQNFSNSELFNIFKSTKLILLFLINLKIITFDDSLLNLIMTKNDKSYLNGIRYCHFFYPEIKQFADKETIENIEDEKLEIDSEIFDNFEEKRLKGENSSNLATFIRNDSIEEFIIYVNEHSLSLENTRIKPSIFETNSFLTYKNPTMIEYAAFYGSIQVFNYLKLNKVELKPSIWLYSIHSDNAELISSLEELEIDPPDDSFETCFIEAIKCHHNEVASYILENLIKSEISDKKNFNENIIKNIFQSFNYEFFPCNLTLNFALYYMFQYNHHELAKLYLKEQQEKFEINQLEKNIFLVDEQKNDR